jgi:hypothetical protein
MHVRLLLKIWGYSGEVQENGTTMHQGVLKATTVDQFRASHMSVLQTLKQVTATALLQGMYIIAGGMLVDGQAMVDEPRSKSAKLQATRNGQLQAIVTRVVIVNLGTRSQESTRTTGVNLAREMLGLDLGRSTGILLALMTKIASLVTALAHHQRQMSVRWCGVAPGQEMKCRRCVTLQLKFVQTVRNPVSYVNLRKLCRQI